MFLDVDFTLPNTYFYVEWQKMAMLFSSCWTIIVLGVLAEIVWIQELLQSEFRKNFSDTANVPELCLFCFFTFCLFLNFWNWMLNTAIFSFFFIILLFFAVFVWCCTGIIQADTGIVQIWESFRQLREKFRQIRSRIISLFFTFCLFLNFWN